MGRAKDIVVRVIPSALGNAFIRKTHYSGKVVPNSTLHFGCFLNEQLHGVMSFGSPLDKRKVIGLVVDSQGDPCRWNEMLELNRMAFDECLPRNSESRCISVAFMLIRKNAPHIRWILSFSDGTQCGDGTIYRASGFKLTGIKKNTGQRIDERTGEVFSQVTFSAHRPDQKGYWKTLKKLEGYQLRYVYIIDPLFHLKEPPIPFSEIERMGATMYRGERPNGTDCAHQPP